jgi:hypothetical protein
MSLPGWDLNKKIEIVIDSSKVDADLVDFPVSIQLSTSAGINNDDMTAIFNEIVVDSNRKKIAITGPDDATELYVDIERWDSANKKATLHVKVPLISSDNDTVISLYYDSNHATNADYVGDSGSLVASNVWDDNFKAVYHMNQDPSGSAPQLLDSTSNNNDGTSSGTMTGGDLIDEGAGKAINFDGADDEFDIGVPVLLSLGQDFCVESYIKPTAIGATEAIFSTGPTSGAYFYAFVKTTGAAQITVDNDTSQESLTTVNTIDAASFHYVLAGREGALLKAVVNDNAYESDNGFDESLVSGNNHLIGALSGVAENFDGDISEIRYSDILRPIEWSNATNYTLKDELLDLSDSRARTGIADVILPALSVEASTPFGNASVVLPRLAIDAEAGIHADGDAELPSMTASGVSGATVDTPLPSLSVYGEGNSDEIFIADLTLPSFTIEMNTGFSADVELKPLELTSSGLHTYPFNGDMALPSLEMDAVNGMIGDVGLSNLTFTGTGLQGVVGNFDNFFPRLIVDAYLDVLQNGFVDVRLKRLLLESAGTVGGVGDLTKNFPRLSLEISAVFGTIGNIDISLPALEESGLNSYHNIVGNMSGTININ